jgi:protein subunit release factor B
MIDFGVSERKHQELLDRMEACRLKEFDLEESFISSGGPGGQKVNRSATCVRLVHTPSRVEVKMQQTRSQALNRYYARRRMCELFEGRLQGDRSPEAMKREQVRKQKARRKRRSRSDPQK